MNGMGASVYVYRYGCQKTADECTTGSTLGLHGGFLKDNQCLEKPNVLMRAVGGSLGELATAL